MPELQEQAEIDLNRVDLERMSAQTGIEIKILRRDLGLVSTPIKPSNFLEALAAYNNAPTDSVEQAQAELECLERCTTIREAEEAVYYAPSGSRFYKWLCQRRESLYLEKVRGDVEFEDLVRDLSEAPSGSQACREAALKLAPFFFKDL